MILMVLLLQGCSTSRYYLQTLHGQLEVMVAQEHINDILSDNDSSPILRERLEFIKSLRKFAIEKLYLPDNNSYTSYADIGREFVVWNVFASPRYSLQPRQWCYPVAGCFSYRGFFSRDAATNFATGLEDQDMDVYVAGVRAYSTLGWLADPVLNTIINQEPTYIARVLFHELAHQKLFLPGDTDFNEAFAETIAREGVLRWLKLTSDDVHYKRYIDEQAREDQFVKLALDYRSRLQALYQGQCGLPCKQNEKNQLLISMLDDYQTMRKQWTAGTNYDTWFALGVNNAKLAAISTYRRLMPGFQKLLLNVNYQLGDFYRVTNVLTKCDKQNRDRILSNPADLASTSYIETTCIPSG